MIVVVRVAHFEGDGDGGEKRVGDMDADVEHQPVDSGRGGFAEIENAPVGIGDAAASIAPAMASDEDIELDWNARGRLAGGRI